MVARAVAEGGSPPGAHALACPGLPWQHVDWWDCATAGPPDTMFDHQADLTGLTGADRHSMKSRQFTCSSPRQGSTAHDGA